MLVVTDQHTAWAWGGNAAGQLGLGSRSPPGRHNAGGIAAGAAAAGPAGVAGLRPAVTAWVAAPLEVVDSVLAASLGMPSAAACGEEHTLLACRDGSVHAAGSNSAGACGLPLVQLASSCFAPVPLPAGETAAAVACGGRNSAVVTANGRLLVCGSNELGQAGVGKPGGAVFLLRDVGPSAAWHGMQRSNQDSGGGGGEAAAVAAGVTVGCGSLYAVTDGGEAFAWGQGGQGEVCPLLITYWTTAPACCAIHPASLHLLRRYFCLWVEQAVLGLDFGALLEPLASLRRRTGAGGQRPQCGLALPHALGTWRRPAGCLLLWPLCRAGGLPRPLVHLRGRQANPRSVACICPGFAVVCS